MRKIFMILPLFLILISGCDYNFNYEEIKTEGTITPTYAVPLIDANFTLEELLPDSSELNRYLEIDQDGFMTLVYKQSLSDVGVSDFLDGAPYPIGLSGPSLPAFDYNLGGTSIDLDLAIDLNGGTVTFFDPKLRVTITNYWNIPLYFNITEMKYYTENDATGKDVTGSFITDTHDLNSPATLNDSVSTVLEMNTDNSNIDEMLSAVPNRFYVDADVGTPGQSTPFDLNGAHDNKAEMEILIPLNLSMNNVAFTDTMDFDLGVNTDSVSITSLALNLDLNNGFPLGIKTQIYFLDENYLIIDSLFDTRLDILPASVSNGVVNTPSKTTATVNIPENKMDNVLNAKYLMPNLILRTTDAENLLPVKLYSTYDLGIKMSAKMDLELIL